MASLLVVKKLSALYAVDEAGETAMRSIGQGEIVEITLRRPRNVQHHRLFWALMGLTWENLSHDTYPAVDVVVVEVKVGTGHYDKRFLHVDGQRYEVLTPRSISFAAMDQVQFAAFFDRCSEWIVANVLPGVTQAELRREIEVMVGVREA